MTRLSRGLAEAGYAALRFDFTGLGQSAGDFADTTLSANVSDLTRAATTLIQEGYGPCGLIGHSLGGAASILAASRLKTVRSLVTIGSPARPDHVRHLFDDEWADLAAGRAATVTIAGRVFQLSGEFVDDLARHDVAQALADFGTRPGGLPYCTIHARDDEVVGFANAETLHDLALEPKRLVALPSGGHLFGPPTAAEAVLAAVLDWFDTTL
jgi:putative redox protein